jgi:hypothetical protein
VPDAQALADFAQLRAGGREESAEQAVRIDLLHPVLPALSITTQPLEDCGKVCGNRCLSLTEEPSHVIDQLGHS